MNSSGPADEARWAGETAKRPLKANKSCVSCRVRKVKCDAAEIGLPCSSCTSRHCAKDCVLPVRKSRTRKVTHGLLTPSPIPTTGNASLSNRSRSNSFDHYDRSKNPRESKQSSSPDAMDHQSPHQTEPDLLYLNILHDAVKETPQSYRNRNTSTTSPSRRRDDSFIPRNSLWAKLPRLDEIDNEYLVKKGVFDLPPQCYLDALVKTYFDRLYPFSPVITRTGFIREYQSGNCSLFLLRAILATASVHAPVDVLSACGFTSRSAAQESFFSKAKLLHDFAAEDDPLLMLQGSLILCTVMLDHPSDRDYGYWFHNAIRLATKLNLRDRCIRSEKHRKVLKVYRRIWWALYGLDVFHVFVNTRRSRLLKNIFAIEPWTEDDWETEDGLGASAGLLSAITPQQRAFPVVQCELSQMFGEFLYTVTKKPPQDPRRIVNPLDAWRRSLAAKMHVDDNTGTDVYYLSVRAMSYRFECILCRLMLRCWQEARYQDWSEWAKQRLRSAVLELDSITARVLASGTLQDFPVTFVTTVPALLALHIESVLDPNETDLVRSMAQISISQAMLILNQGKEIPALKRALPVFEEILARKSLYLIPPNSPSQQPARLQPQDSSAADTSSEAYAQVSLVSSYSEQYEHDTVLEMDSLGFDFLDEWQIGQLNFTG